MSQFANPAGAAAKASAAAYTASILATLGERDPFHVIRETPAALTRAIAGCSGTMLARPESPGKWSTLQVLQHLADSDLVLGYRTRLILAADRPEIVGYDQDRWIETVHRADTSATELIERIAAIRKGNLALLEATTPAERERIGVHNERGEESIGLIIKLYAGHDLVHLRQLERIRTAAKV